MKKASLFTIFFLSFAFQAAFAQDKGGFMRVEKTAGLPQRGQQGQPSLQTQAQQIPRIESHFGQGIQVATPGHMTTTKSEIFDKLINVTDNSPSWPAFPRIWHEESVLNTVETSTYWLPRLKVLNGGVEAEYKYGVKTTLVMMSSLHRQGAASELNGRESIKIENEAYKMIRLDPETKRVYPNIREGYPMVGFCSFELQLTLANGQSFGIEVFGAGLKTKHTKVRNVTHTIFSKFFPIPAGAPVQTIMNNYCSSTFAKLVRPFAEENFIPVVIEEIFLHSPRNQCHPHAKDSQAGDFECMRWFEGFDRIRKHVAVPRCVTTKAGFNVCRLKAKEGNKCPLYKDKKGQIFTSVEKYGLQSLTKTKFAFQCDAGMSCVMSDPPSRYLNGLIEFKGEARCR